MYHFARWRNIFQKVALAQHVSAKERVNTRRVNDTELIEGWRDIAKMLLSSVLLLRSYCRGFYNMQIYSPPFKAVILLNRLRPRCKMKHVSNFGRIRRSIYLLKLPDRLYIPNSLLFVWFQRFFPRDPKQIIHPMPKLRMRESIHPVSSISELRALLPN
jgi:hypothetical protein